MMIYHLPIDENIVANCQPRYILNLFQPFAENQNQTIWIRQQLMCWICLSLHKNLLHFVVVVVISLLFSDLCWILYSLFCQTIEFSSLYGFYHADNTEIQWLQGKISIFQIECLDLFFSFIHSVCLPSTLYMYVSIFFTLFTDSVMSTVLITLLVRPF